MGIDCLLPAAGRIEGEFAIEAGTRVKALIPMRGSTLLERTISELISVQEVGRIVVIGPEEVARHPSSQLADAVLPEGLSGPDNVLRGMEWLRQANGGTPPDRVLILTTDLPFITADSINGFVSTCPGEKDICVPVYTKEEFAARYPDSENEFVRLRDGKWTMGCAFLVNPGVLLRNRELIESVFEIRKSQLGMARLLGPGFVIKFLLGRLTLGDVAQRCAQIVGCTCHPLRGCDPHLAFDIDKLGEYRYAAKALSI